MLAKVNGIAVVGLALLLGGAAYADNNQINQGSQNMKNGNMPRMTTNSKQLGNLCGVEVDEVKAPKSTYEDVIYYFCTENERAQFQKSPRRYVQQYRQNNGNTNQNTNTNQ